MVRSISSWRVLPFAASVLLAGLALGGCSSSTTVAGTKADAGACPSGQSSCSGTCVDSAHDPQNCGSCGHACAAGQVCAAGTCSTSCGSGQTECTADGGAPYCANTDSDNQNCGSCGHACAAGQVCSSGKCSSTCSSSQTLCTPEAGAPYCASTDSDNQNCGSCGHGCAANQHCVSGKCTAAQCTSNADCDDGLYCDGVEKCAPSSPGANAFGCVAGTYACANQYQTCDETTKKCSCSIDEDGDKLASSLCGGPDCNDAAYGWGLGDWAECGKCGNACAVQQSCAAGKCVAARRVFISSVAYSGNFGGVAGADADCQGLATAAKLGGTWKAYIADATTGTSRLSQANVPYVRLDGVKVANNWADLSDLSILAPIDITEKRTVANSDTWTGIGSTGGIAQTCNNWSTSAGGCLNGGPCGQGGEAGQVNAHWQGYYVFNCNQMFRLYCIEQ